MRGVDIEYVGRLVSRKSEEAVTILRKCRKSDSGRELVLLPRLTRRKIVEL
jgi:hypothetical protein